MRLFLEQPIYLNIFQIGLDLVLILFLMIFLVKRSRSARAVENFTLSLQKVIEDTRAISEQFDSNLEERKRIIQQFIFNLDQHIRGAEKVCQRLETLQKEARNVPQPITHHPTQSSLPSNDHHEIFLLAQKGFDAEFIAKRLQKPVGEVQLILNLYKMSSGK